jgi:hypothetical protein
MTVIASSPILTASGSASSRRDLRDEPIEERKAELTRLLTGRQPLALVLNPLIHQTGLLDSSISHRNTVISPSKK